MSVVRQGKQFTGGAGGAQRCTEAVSSANAARTKHERNSTLFSPKHTSLCLTPHCSNVLC